jgi:excisionase family DNA binding protein
MTRQLYTVPEVLERLEVGETKLYALLRRGDLPRVKIGRRTYVPAAELDSYLAGRGVAPAQEAPVIRHSPTCSYLVFHNRPCDCPAGQSQTDGEGGVGSDS